MMLTSISKSAMYGLLAVGALCIASALPASGQVQTETKTAPAGAPTKTVTIKRGEIVYVSGNNVVIKMEDGTLRHFDNVPDTTTVTVDGKQLNVHQIKPGMIVEKQTVTITSPKMITTVKTVSGTVWQVTPPNSVILTLEDGKNQRFKIPKGQKFNINGQETDAFGLKKGMKIDAQMVVEQPETVVTQQSKLTGTMPPPPPAPKPDVPILVATTAPAPAPVEQPAATPEPAPQKLPKTASELPLLGLFAMLSIALGLGLKALRLRIS
jgi:RNase P/RNase MRP subunit p29